MHYWEQRRDLFLRAGDWEYTIRHTENWELYHRHIGDTFWSLLGEYPTLELAQAAL